MVNNVNARARLHVFLAIFSGSLLLASAQIQGHASGQDQSSGQNRGIDPALVAKATAGDAPSMLLVAKAYTAGSGVDQDDTIAADWYRKAADQGNTEAEIRLAECYRDGRGLTRDMAQAAAWYRKAAEKGDPSAQATLGVLLSMGQGVSRDDVEAYFWFDLAASTSSPNQDRYVANRQNVGTRITADEVALVRQRVAKWKAAHNHRSTGE
jgi:TPR repeat protein